jgi:hypothetical protein
MRRNELKAGGLYVGPGDKCYEIFDLSPGWRVGPTGEWIEDSATRTRHMPGKGNVSYRTNLAIRVLLHEDQPDGSSTRAAVIDPRKLTKTWAEHMEEVESSQSQLAEAQTVVRTARQVLRNSSGYRPGSYVLSPDGHTVTLPTEDLAVLARIRQGVQGSTEVTWVSP